MAVEKDPLGISGTVLDGRYLVRHAVGEGGAAFVYKGTHTQAGVSVAIKLLHSLAQVPEAERPVVFEELRREGNLISDLSTRTSAIVQSRDLGVLELPGRPPFPYLVLEWLDGRSLDEVLVGETNAGKAPRGLADAVALLEPIAGAVGIAHERGVVHRDLKPENIFVIEGASGPGSRIKLLDFGIAKVMQRRMPGLHQTGTAPTAFTPHYGAPEQFSRTYGETGPWTDVYAMALVLVEVMLGGRRAYLGDEYMELARQACDEQRRPTPRARGLAVSDAVDAVFARALAVAPPHRYGSMSDFWAALVSAVHPSAAAFPLAGPSAAAAQSLASGAIPAQTGPVVGELRPSGARPSRIIPLALAGGVLLIVSGAVVAGLRLAKKPDAGAASADASASGAARSAAPSVAPSGAASATSSAAALCPASAVVVAGGRFGMGLSDASLPEDGPRHFVNVDAFCLDRSEVTAASYAACVAAKQCTPVELATAPKGGAGCTPGAAGLEGHPANCVDFSQAEAYCRFRGMRLPSEAEFERAARSGGELPWSGEASPTRANLDGQDGFATTAPVGSFPTGATADGVLDLIGNVAEWQADFFAPYDAAEAVNPKGPPSGTNRVVRGGAFSGLRALDTGPKPSKLTVAHRESAPPTTRSASVGFRCAADLKR